MRPGSTRAVIAMMVACVWTWRQHREARRHLAVMSERDLQDIGIGRPEMLHEISKPSWP
jgi:uncharacterized protein YjiS (DUF1127 family)